MIRLEEPLSPEQVAVWLGAGADGTGTIDLETVAAVELTVLPLARNLVAGYTRGVGFEVDPTGTHYGPVEQHADIAAVIMLVCGRLWKNPSQFTAENLSRARSSGGEIGDSTTESHGVTGAFVGLTAFEQKLLNQYRRTTA